MPYYLPGAATHPRALRSILGGREELGGQFKGLQCDHSRRLPGALVSKPRPTAVRMLLLFRQEPSARVANGRKGRMGL